MVVVVFVRVVMIRTIIISPNPVHTSRDSSRVYLLSPYRPSAGRNARGRSFPFLPIDSGERIRTQETCRVGLDHPIRRPPDCAPDGVWRVRRRTRTKSEGMTATGSLVPVSPRRAHTSSFVPLPAQFT